MKQRYQRGLVVGKFCPLHLGHEWLITQAQSSCDELIILSYTDLDLPAYGIEQRERWLKSRFPDVRALIIDQQKLVALTNAAMLRDTPKLPADKASDDEHRYFVAWLCMNLLRITVNAVFTSEDYGNGFAKVLAQCFRHPVDHVCVDKARAKIPVSGSMIRSDPHTFRDYLAPEVYADFVRRVAILGGESSGKTTLARALAERLNTCWAPEYGREIWCAKSGVLSLEDMTHIAQTQITREENLIRMANGWLICDTTPLTTLFYCEEIFGFAPQGLRLMAERSYDLTIVCDPDFPFVQDGTRQNDHFRSSQHIWYQAQLTRRRTGFYSIRGPLQHRLEAVELLTKTQT